MPQGTGKDRTIFILFIPGGAMLGIIPAVALARLEQLTETPVSELFQVVDGVSTGSILAAGMNIRHPEDPAKPKVTSRETVDLFCNLGPLYFPAMPGRFYRMIAANVLNTVGDMLDPLHADAPLLHEMKRSFDEIRRKASPVYAGRIAQLESAFTAQWLSRGGKKKGMDLSAQLGADAPELADMLLHVNELLFMRPTHGLLSSTFRRVALCGMDLLRKLWARDYLFDPAVPAAHFQELFNGARMSDCLRSTYISAYDLQNNRVQTFFCRKTDFFSTDPATPSETSPNNPHLWDAVMASIANPFAFPPHATEDGILCSDKAFIHTPIHCVQDVLAHKPTDAKVKLVVLGTGQYLSKKNGRENEDLRDEYVRYGVLGNLIRGQEILELESYAMSEARSSLSQSLGNENIIEFLPHLAPRGSREAQDLPSKDILDASDENIQKILKKAQDFIQKEDKRLRGLARMMAENLHNLGQMDDEKYQRVLKNLKYAGKPCIPGLAPPEENTFDRILGACPGLRSVFGSIARWIDPPPVPVPCPVQDNAPRSTPANDDREDGTASPLTKGAGKPGDDTQGEPLRAPAP